MSDPSPGEVCPFSTDCVKILDAEGVIRVFNEDGLRLMDIADAAQVVGRYWPLLWPADGSAVAEQGLATAKKTGLASFTAACPTALGTPKWWDVTIAAVPGSEPSFVVVSRDVTAAHDELEASRQQHERLRQIVNSHVDVLWDIDLQTDRVWWSEGIHSVFGYGPDQVGESTKWCHAHIHPEDRARVVSGMAEAVDDGSATWEDEFRYRAADGSYIEVLDRGSILRDGDGKALRFVGVMQDVSARNAVAATQKLVAGELSHRINNIIALVGGLFQQTLRTSRTKDELGVAFAGRLVALANANAAVAQGAGLEAPLWSLIQAQLSPFIGAGRLVTHGPAIQLSAAVAQPLALTLNELATNALKYGALSNAEGVVTLRWALQDGRLALSWSESGGPTVRTPRKEGLGSTLIEKGIPGARVKRAFAPAGFTCDIALPI